MTDDCKRKFRQETKNIYLRLVRKFGADVIIKFVPNTDVQTHVRLRSIKKESERLKRNKEKRTKDKINNEKVVDFNLKTKPKTFVFFLKNIYYFYISFIIVFLLI